MGSESCNPHIHTSKMTLDLYHTISQTVTDRTAHSQATSAHAVAGPEHEPLHPMPCKMGSTNPS